MEEFNERRINTESFPKFSIRQIVKPGSVTSALELLRMARKLDRYRKTARMVLETWIIEGVLARLSERPVLPISELS